MKTIQPSPSYQVIIPDDTVENVDGKVSSYWRPGSALLLQLSSTLRSQGEQVPAASRLRDLHNRLLADWSPFNLKLESFPGDFAGSQMTDDGGEHWIHAYLTTNDLAVYATISGAVEHFKDESNWAIEAVRTLRMRPIFNDGMMMPS